MLSREVESLRMATSSEQLVKRSKVSLLGVAGIVLWMVFSATACCDWFLELSKILDGTRLAAPPGYVWGEFGLIVFAVGLVNATSLSQERSLRVCGSLALAAVCFLIAAIANLYAVTVLHSVLSGLGNPHIIVMERDVFEAAQSAWVATMSGAGAASCGAVLLLMLPARTALDGRFIRSFGTWRVGLAVLNGLFIVLFVTFGSLHYRYLVATLEAPPPYDIFDFLNESGGLVATRFFTSIAFLFVAIQCAMMAETAEVVPTDGRE